MRSTILISINMLPSSSLKKEINNHQQPVAFNSYKLPLIHWEEVGLYMNPVRSQPNNLQKIVSFCLLKRILFRHVHIDQHKAETPIHILALSALHWGFPLINYQTY
jgi:hypothetical protein